MPDKELNIKSSTIEKGLELAKEFLGKLISPTIEEVGLLISENVKFLRFKNQIRILLKAKDYVDKKKINLKEIPIKILVPLLEKASLEDDETMQDKWANMLVNLVDSQMNLQNQIFPYLLSQISIEEYNELKSLSNEELQFIRQQMDYYKLLKDDQFAFKNETRRAKEAIDKIEQGGFQLNLEDYEKANLFRLGLVRQLPPKIYIEEFNTGNRDEGEKWHQLEAGYDTENYGYRITELGDKFLEICELEEEKASR
jgi:hypothetical protein